MPTFDSTTFKFRLEQDQDCPNPLTDCDGMPKVAYLSRSRYALGSEAVDQERMDEIAKGIESGKLIGLPVYAYVHSGVSLSTEPFSCPWDSGQSGFVYETKETILEWYGKKRMTKQLRAKAEASLKSCLEEYSKWLGGDCYGYIIEDADGNEYDSCWGFIGHEYATQEAKEALARVIEDERKNHEADVRSRWTERRERRYWAQRDVVTA